MRRRNREVELLQHRFEHFSDEVRETICEVQKQHKCSDTDDHVIDALWAKCRPQVREIFRGEGISQRFRDPISEAARTALRSYLDRALDYDVGLMDQEDDAFEAAYREVFVPISRDKKDLRDQQARERDRWDFFNQPGAEADFEKWSRKMLWPAQAVALSLGKDPDVVNLDSLGPLQRPGKSHFREEFEYRLKLIETAIEVGDLDTPTSIKDFALWAEKNGTELPLPLRVATTDVTSEARDWKSRFEDCQERLNRLLTDVEDIAPKSKKTVYTIILGMAVAKFGHRTDRNSPAATNIFKAGHITALHLSTAAADR